MKELIEIYTCDICGKESDPELMIHTPSGKDVCAECLEKLVDDHFARQQKFDEVLESASEKKPVHLPHKHQEQKHEDAHEPDHKKYNLPEVPLNKTELSEEEVKQLLDDRAAGASIKQLKFKYNIGYDRVTKLIRPEEKQTFDWEEAQKLRDAGWSVGRIADKLGCSDQAVYNHTVKPEAKAKKPKRPFEWAQAAIDAEPEHHILSEQERKALHLP